MPPAATLACSRCGRPVVVPAESSAVVPRCVRCTPGSTEPSFEVRTPTGRASMDLASVLDRLASGELSGTDWVHVEGRPVLIAAHPAFSARFARGEFAPRPAPAPASTPPPPRVAPPPGVLPPPSVPRPPRRPPLPWGRMFTTTATVVGLGALGWFGWSERDTLYDLAARFGALVAPGPEGAAPPAPKPVVEPGRPAPDPLAALAAAEGPVDEPLALLSARAVAAWADGTADGDKNGLLHARRAAARATGDADAVALLATFASWAGTEPGLVTLAGERAVELGAGGPATQLGRAALAVGNHDLPGAVAAVAPCVATGDRLCRAVAARATLAQPGHEAAAIAALDSLRADWPQNKALPRLAALAAVTADLPDARARLVALKSDEPAVLAARGELALRDGDLTTAATLATRLGADAPPALRIGVARTLLATGDGKRVLGFVEGVTSDSREESVGLRLLEAQGHYLIAAKDPAAVPAAREAVARLLDLGRSDPAVAQVRALVAHLAGDRAEEAKAWDSMDPARRTGPELARVYKTQAALMLDQEQSGSEILPVAEAARTADPADPYTHVWVIHVNLVGHNRGKALDAMREAIRQVDGQAARRRRDLATLETGSPAKKLRALVDEAVGNEATATSQLPLAGGVASWLAGDLPGARAALGALPHIEDDPDALALRARLRASGGDATGAIADWDAVIAVRPKESAWLLGGLSARVQAGRAKEAGPLAELVKASKQAGALAPATLAEVALATGDRPGALVLLADAVATDPLDIKARARLTELRAGK